MSNGHYAWGSLRRTGRQLAFAAAVVGVGFAVIVVSLLVLGASE